MRCLIRVEEVFLHLANVVSLVGYVPANAPSRLATQQGLLELVNANNTHYHYSSFYPSRLWRTMRASPRQVSSSPQGS